MALVRQHLRQEWTALVGWAVAVAVTAFGLDAAFAVFPPALVGQVRSLYDRMPAGVSAFLGGTATFPGARGWAAGLALGGMVPLVIAVFVALAALSVVVEDRDSGGLEFLLALPVRRERLIVARAASVVGQLVALEVIVCLGAVLGLAAIGHQLPLGRLAATALVVLLAQTALAGTLVLCSLALRDPVQAMLVDHILAIGLFLLPALADHSAVRYVSPFTYAGGAYLVGGGFPVGHVLVLAAWTVAAFGIAAVWFGRMDT